MERIIHPTIEEYPVGTRIQWNLDDQGPLREGQIVDYLSDEPISVLILDFNDNNGRIYHSSDVFIKDVIAPDSPTSVFGSSKHPNYKKYPVGTEFTWTRMEHGGVMFDGQILAWNTNKKVPDQVKLLFCAQHSEAENTEGWFHVEDIWVVSATVPQQKPNWVNATDHPVGTRMYVAYWLGGGFSPDRDVTVNEWSSNGQDVKLQVNVEGGILAWHPRDTVLFLGLIEDKEPSEEVNVSDEFLYHLTELKRIAADKKFVVSVTLS